MRINESDWRSNCVCSIVRIGKPTCSTSKSDCAQSFESSYQRYWKGRRVSQYVRAFDKLLVGYPNNYASEQMRTLWLDNWSQHPISVISRTVDTIIRTWQRFPSIDEFMDLAEKEANKQSFIGRREKMETCPKCDQGMVETKENHFRPCEDCLPDSYGQWASGVYEPRS